ncbi:hypothetical protein HF313_18840 [Massilia atriviolacea]|uniref:Uncharacterized protein n=1 Tax=Massilia atriviolacea TaxID=2495579 RepID=A0A430HT13_9BURK|nr:hypothetical protein [Massilia atriviolacea]RSZ60660.1 hypothetical protein EJB06_00540 [Massilia atriviolacea]
MTLTHLTAAVVLAASCGAALADATEQEAIQAQVAAAMASADYAAANCPKLTVDKERLESQVKRSGMSADQLRASEDYDDQRQVIKSIAGTDKAAMLCILLPKAHGGYGRGIVVVKD